MRWGSRQALTWCLCPHSEAEEEGPSRGPVLALVPSQHLRARGSAPYCVCGVCACVARAVFGWGVQGGAMAVVLSQGVSAVVLWGLLIKQNVLRWKVRCGAPVLQPAPQTAGIRPSRRCRAPSGAPAAATGAQRAAHAASPADARG